MISEISKKIKKNVEDKKNIPAAINGYKKAEFMYMIAASVIAPNKTIKSLSVNINPKSDGNKIFLNIPTKDCITLCKKFVSFCKKNKRIPNYITYKQYKISPDLFTYCMSKIMVFYFANKRLPSYCNFNSDVFNKKAKVKGGVVCKSLSARTGVVITDYKTLYKAMSKFSYQYYLNDIKPRNKTISNKAGNCVDLNQLAYYALKEMSYKVDIVRGDIKCTSGTFGHVWCKLHLSSGSINFDASAAAKGKSIGKLICGKTKQITNINPSWVLSDDGRT